MSTSIQSNLLYADVLLAQKGDHQAFGRLINETRNLVVSIALSIVKDLDNSEDVAQQVYLGAWQQLNELKNTASFLPWLRQMTRYKALNFLRDNKTKQKVSSSQADQILADYCDPNASVSDNLAREQSNEILQHFMHQLPDESREIVLLYYREEQSTQQVATLLDQNEANIRKKLSRARQVLHEKILHKHGKLLLSTAPTVGLTSFVLGAITTSTPAAAAAVSSATASSKSGFLSKFGMLLGGSLIGAALAVIAVRLSTFLLLKNLSSESARQQVLSYRKSMTIWLIFGGLLLTLGYELTEGWWGPICAYLIFATGVTLITIKLHRLITAELLIHPTDSVKLQRRRKIQKFCGFAGTIFGMSTGFAALIVGLINSGRLVL